MTAGRDPNSVVAQRQSRSIKTLSFPPDQAPIHFVIRETQWEQFTSAFDSLNSIRSFRDLSRISVSQLTEDITRSIQDDFRLQLNTEAIYRLPLPRPLVDQFGVSYDENFSLVEQAASAVGATRLLNTVTNLARPTGYLVNSFKTVVLDQPHFREHNFTWKLGAKTFQESRTLQTILFKLRQGMTPKRKVGRGILEFPNIFVMYFTPNVQYLYKFKPCVLKSLSVNYMGGQEMPAFFNPPSGSVKDSAPESVEIQTSWLELEYWIHGNSEEESDYKTDGNGMPSNDPTDGFHYYQLDGGGQL